MSLHIYKYKEKEKEKVKVQESLKCSKYLQLFTDTDRNMQIISYKKTDIPPMPIDILYVCVYILTLRKIQITDAAQNMDIVMQVDSI